MACGGWVKLRSFTGEPEAIFSYSPVTDKTGQRIFKLSQKGLDKGAFLAAVEGIETRTEADSLRGTDLYIPRDLLPAAEDGEYYHFDLVGLIVLDKDNQKIGNVKAVHDFGSGDTLEIETEPKKTFMILMNKSNVLNVDLNNGTILIDRPVEV